MPPRSMEPAAGARQIQFFFYPRTIGVIFASFSQMRYSACLYFVISTFRITPNGLLRCPVAAARARQMLSEPNSCCACCVCVSTCRHKQQNGLTCLLTALYFQLRHFLAFLVLGQLCCSCQGEESSTIFMVRPRTILTSVSGSVGFNTSFKTSTLSKRPSSFCLIHFGGT